jgi:predicted PurR-regulated permease PerM
MGTLRSTVASLSSRAGVGAEGGRYDAPQVDEDRSRVLGTPFVIRSARWGIVAWATIGVLVLGFFVLRYVVYPIRVIFPPLVVAMIGVYLLNPIVSALERRGLARIWGTLLTYLVGAAIFGMALTLTIPIVAEQVTSFARSAPGLIDRVTESFGDLAAGFGLQVQDAAGGGESVVDFFGRLLSITQGLFDLAIIFVVGPIIAFYLLVDLPKIRRGLKALIPTRRRAEVESVLEKMGRAVGGFFRGQLLVSLFVGIASAIGLWIVGLPFWAVVGLVSGLFNLIPLVGPFIGGIVAVVIAFTTETPGEGLMSLEPGWPLAIGSAVALLTVQQIDNHILSPNIVARTVRLHPVTVMLGLLAGGTLLGLWGMLLAVPVLASIKVVLLHAWDTRMQWPPPSSAPETPGPGDGRTARVPPDPPLPSERLSRAKVPVRETERRGSWWWGALRTVFGPRRTRAEPERTSPPPS